MNPAKTLLLCFTCLISISMYSQDFVELYENSILEEQSGNLAKSLELIKDIKENLDLRYYLLLRKNIEFINDNEESISLLRELQSIQFWKFKDQILQEEARELYVWSSRRMIDHYKCNVEFLKSIAIVPAYRSELYPFIKRSIINAGGTWDRGEIAKPILSPPLKSIQIH